MSDGVIKTQSLIEMSLGVAIGAITFAGSLIAFAKLNGIHEGAPIMLPARHLLNLVLFVSLIALIVYFTHRPAGMGLLGDRRPQLRFGITDHSIGGAYHPWWSRC